MPYIAQKKRARLDPLIDQLAERIAGGIKASPDDAAFAGLLNYACTRLALKVMRIRSGKIRYGLIALVTGVFNNISDEFYRRLAAPYEDRQIKKNGDVDLYKTYSKEIRKL